MGTILFKKLKRISPSQFYSMKQCPYKALLAEAFDRKPLLPLSPKTYLGTVLHKILEAIAKGEIVNETDFNERFDAEIKIMEDFLRRDGYEWFIPLRMNVRDFGIKKIQLRKHLRQPAKSRESSKMINFSPEDWVESRDKLIGGKIDLVIEDEAGVEIVDFKTGAITADVLDDNGESYTDIKPEYKEQLKLYAYLYFEGNGRFPTKLSLVDLAKQKFNVEFTEQECKGLFDEAKGALLKVNESVDSKRFQAFPSEPNCKYCLYRPSCSFYLDYLKTNPFFNDVIGSIINVVKYQNGSVTVFLNSGTNRVSIAGFASDKYDYFGTIRNKEIGCFNLKKEAIDHFYSATKTTMIYEAGTF